MWFLALPVICGGGVLLSGFLVYRSRVKLVQYNTLPSQYLQEIPVPDADGLTVDLGVIEFDDQGVFWSVDQLEALLLRIKQRNDEVTTGIVLVLFIHGWKHNADPDRPSNMLASFKDTLVSIAKKQLVAGPRSPDRVIGVYIGWRGLSADYPILRELTFWGRRATAERVASLIVRESLFRIILVTEERPQSKCLFVGHSMGGIVLQKSMGPPSPPCSCRPARRASACRRTSSS